MKIAIPLILNRLGYFSTLLIFACSSSLQKEKIEYKNLFISKDYNIFISNSRDEVYRHGRYFISKEILKNIDLGIAEEDLYKIIGSKTFTDRLTFKKVLAKRLMQYKYIPVSKMILFNGGNTKVTKYSNHTSYETSERMSITFFFYQDRLIYKSILHDDQVEGKTILLPETSKEMIKSDMASIGKIDASNGISTTNYRHDLKYYAFLNDFISEKFAEDGKRYFIPNVKVSIYTHSKNFISSYCDNYAYWEFPDFESDLKKSGYYKLKAKLDKDYENKTGYWEEKSKI